LILSHGFGCVLALSGVLLAGDAAIAQIGSNSRAASSHADMTDN
jgi:hypothetical protein